MERPLYTMTDFDNAHGYEEKMQMLLHNDLVMTASVKRIQRGIDQLNDRINYARAWGGTDAFRLLVDLAKLG